MFTEFRYYTTHKPDDEIDSCRFRLSSFLYDLNGSIFLHVYRIGRVMYYWISKLKYVSNVKLLIIVKFCFFLIEYLLFNTINYYFYAQWRNYVKPVFGRKKELLRSIKVLKENNNYKLYIILHNHIIWMIIINFSFEYLHLQMLSLNLKYQPFWLLHFSIEIITR